MRCGLWLPVLWRRVFAGGAVGDVILASEARNGRREEAFAQSYTPGGSMSLTH